MADNRRSSARHAVSLAGKLTLPGAPFLYYGEEVGLQNGPTSADESKRVSIISG